MNNEKNNNVFNLDILSITDQLKSICELATIECCYHTVADIYKDKGGGVFSLLKSDRKFWIQTVSKLKIGIDLNQFKIDIQGKKIVCTLPKAKILGEPSTDREQLVNDENSIIRSKDGLIFKNPIEPEEQSKALTEAHKRLKEQVNNNETLLNQARDRAKILLKQYIDQIIKISNLRYTITFVMPSDKE